MIVRRASLKSIACVLTTIFILTNVQENRFPGSKGSYFLLNFSVMISYIS